MDIAGAMILDLPYLAQQNQQMHWIIVMYRHPTTYGVVQFNGGKPQVLASGETTRISGWAFKAYTMAMDKA